MDYVLCVSIYIDGVLVDYFETPLGRYCPAGDEPQDPDWSGDEPNTQNTFENVVINFGEEDGTHISQSFEAITADSSNVYVSWYAYKAEGGLLKFKSYEKIIVQKTIFGDYIDKTVHMSMSPEGIIVGQSVSSILNYAQDLSDGSVARIKLSFKDKRTYNINGAYREKISTDITAGTSWPKSTLIY